jgi:homoserine kinase type II
MSETAQRYRHSLIDMLRANDFPTAGLIRTRNDDTLVEIDGRYYEVMEFLKGEDYNPARPQQLDSVGETLAQYHTLVRDWPAPPDSAELRYSPESLMHLIETLLERDIMGDLYESLSWYDAQVTKLRAALSSEEYLHLPHLVIHGDMHRDNVLFQYDEVLALLDFDQVAWDTPVADLADALIAFASVDKPRALNWGVFPGPLHEARAERLLAAYGSVAPLSENEIAMLPILLEVHWLHAELGRVISTPEGAPDYHLSVLEQGMQLAQWMDDRRERLVDYWLNLMNNTPALYDEGVMTAA